MYIGQLKFELALQIDNYQYHGLNQNNEVNNFLTDLGYLFHERRNCL